MSQPVPLIPLSRYSGGGLGWGFRRSATKRGHDRRILQDRAGLTLIELVIVVSILAIVAGFIIPTAAFMEKRAKYTATKASLGTLRDAIMGTSSAPGYLQDTGQLPHSLNDLVTNPFSSLNPFTSGNPGGAFDPNSGRGWHGPYVINPTFLDAWGGTIVLQVPALPTIVSDPSATAPYSCLVAPGPDGAISTNSVSGTAYPVPSTRDDDIVLFIDHADHADSP